MKLSNNYTTPEQSKRLLEFGIPANSADCFYDSWGQIQWRQKADLHNDFFKVYPYYFPCWSVGRLIEIIMLLNKRSLLFFSSIIIRKTDVLNNTLIDELVKYIVK